MRWLILLQISLLAAQVLAQSQQGMVQVNFQGTGAMLVADIQDQKQININQIFEHFFPTFQYTLEVTQPLKVLTTTSMWTCGVVLSPGYIRFQKREGQITFGEYREIPLQPKTSDSPAIQDMAVCNPFTDECAACLYGDTGYEATVKVYRSDVGVQLDRKCVFFRQIDCGARVCRQGEYATGYLDKDGYGFVVSKTRCVSCSPGTWLTCIDDAACQYTIPTSPGSFETGGAIYKPSGQEPVGQCFSCQTAGAGKVHYGQTNRRTLVDIWPSDPLPWYCPGGDSPPVLCHDPFVGANENFTACVCRPGYYPVNSGAGCLVCPAGFMCPRGEKEECPDDTYQDQQGATMCFSCFLDDGQTNVCDIDAINPKKMRMCRGAFKAERPLCVGCNACRRAYDDLSPGVIDCY